MSKLITIFFLFLSLVGFGQNKNINFNRVYSTDLNVQSAYFQSFDENGNLWAVSEKGLFKYDGYITTFLRSDSTNKQGIISNKIRQLTKLSDNEFWLIYSDSHILSKFNPVTNEFKHFFTDTVTTKNFPKTPIVKTFRDSRNNLWIATWGEGLVKLNEATGETKTFIFTKDKDNKKPLGRNIKDLTELEDGRLLITFFYEYSPTESWPVYFDTETEAYERMNVEKYFSDDININTKKRIKQSLKIVNFVHRDINNNLWFGCYNGLIHFDSKDSIFSQLTAQNSSSSVKNLENSRTYIYHDNYLWVATTNSGILRVNISTKEVRSINRSSNNTNGFFDNRMYTLSIDPFNNIWISTESGDFIVYIPKIQQFQVHDWSNLDLKYSNIAAQAIPVNQILVRPNGTILVSDGYGLRIYSTEKRCFVDTIIPEKSVTTFKETESKIIFDANRAPSYFNKKEHKSYVIGGKRYHADVFFRHNPEIDKEVFYQRNLNYLFENVDGTDSLTILAKFDNSFELTPAFSMVLESGEWLFSERYGRFVIFDPKTNTPSLFSPSRKDSYFPDSTILSAYKDSDKSILIGTSYGLYRFNESSKKSEKINKEFGIPEETPINAIIRDDNGDLWLALKVDLLKYETRTKTTKKYGRESGLDVGRFLQSIAQKDTLGNLIFVTQNGILVFNPNKIDAQNKEIKLKLSTISIDDDTLSTESSNDFLNGKLQLKHAENIIEFAFGTNQVFEISPHQFEYRLLGQSNNWISNSASNKIRFSNLNHGSYVLEVRVTNSFGNESEVIKIPFKIDIPFWLTYWFYIFIFSVLALLTFVYIKKREQKLVKQKLVLENIVTERTKEAIHEKNVAEQLREEAVGQKIELEQKQKEITDSISYAKRIQDAILPSDEAFNQHIPNSFVMYVPKDIVAGDFYWMQPFKDGNTIFFAAADCTGHGVPGAMVSVVCNNALNRSVREFNITDPGKLLDKTRELVVSQFEKEYDASHATESTIKDGMDISVCLLNKATKELKWAGANNPLWIVRDGELIEIKGDKQPVGKHEPETPFTTHTMTLLPNDTIYIFSDGYADQFGGDKGKKFKTSSLRKLMLEVSNLPVNAQVNALSQTFELWKGDLEQLDDVCIIGVKL